MSLRPFILTSRASKQLVHCMQAFAAAADALTWDDAGSSLGYAASPVDAEAIAAECVSMILLPISLSLLLPCGLHDQAGMHAGTWGASTAAIGRGCCRCWQRTAPTAAWPISAATPPSRSVFAFHSACWSSHLSLCGWAPEPACRQVQEVAALLDRLFTNLAPGLRLVIDESSGASSASAGIVWHAELDGRPLPGGKVGDSNA